jgi:hypothetical protein
MAASPDASEDDIVRQLQQQGYSTVAAEKLNAFVPSAFSWALLKRMGVTSFPSHYIALAANGTEVQLPIAEEHYFTAALHLAYVTLEEGWNEVLPRGAFEAVLGRSAEMGAANEALNQSGSIEGASLGPLRVFRFSAEAASGS